MSGAVKIDRRLYLTADATRVVEEGDPEAAILLCPAGGEVPHATATRYGLLKKADAELAAKPEPEPEVDQEQDEAKQGRTPANKARKPAADK